MDNEKSVGRKRKNPRIGCQRKVGIKGQRSSRWPTLQASVYAPRTASALEHCENRFGAVAAIGQY
jgi:hypothetical protein